MSHVTITDMKSNYYKLDGNIFLWKYLDNQSNYPGINVTADENGCNSLLKLLSLLATPVCKPTKTLMLSTTSSTIASVGTRSSRFKSFQCLTLNFTIDQEKIWIIEELATEDVAISFSNIYLNQFRNAIQKVKTGEGDFLITDKKRKNVLYFWWHLHQ